MVLGGVSRVWTRVVSTPALALLRKGGVEVAYAKEVPCIINRTRTGRCPLETLCDVSDNPVELYPVIEICKPHEGSRRKEKQSQKNNEYTWKQP